MTFRFNAEAVLAEITEDEGEGVAKPAKSAKAGYAIRTLPKDLGAITNFGDRAATGIASLKRFARSTTRAKTAQGGDTSLYVPNCELSELLGTDWDWIRNDPKFLGACRQAETVRRMREAGIVPSHYTDSTVCGHCGCVPIFPGCPDKVMACPWCFNRLKRLPIPIVPHRDNPTITKRLS